MQKAKIVAHRGFAEKYPENSLSAFEAAIDCNCKYLELDVQLTNDLVPVVIHDSNLKRTADKNVDVLESKWSDISQVTIGEAKRFKNKFSAEKLAKLEDFCDLLKRNPSVNAFVEIKEESISKFSCEKTLLAVSSVLARVKNQCTLISFDANILFEAKKLNTLPLGYILRAYDKSHLNTAKKLQPEVLICNYLKIPDKDDVLWPGSWDWFIYEVTSPEVATKWIARGVSYIETMKVQAMMEALASDGD